MSRHKSMRFLESPATPEEDSYDYRVEWDDATSSIEEMMNNGNVIKHYGPGSEEFSALDPAWDLFTELRECIFYRGVRLIQIDHEGKERVRNQ